MPAVEPARVALARSLGVVRRVTLPIWIALGAVLAAAVYAKFRLGVPWYFVMGDPATTTRSPFFVGFVSNVGALTWAATSTIFLFRHVLERASAPSPWSRFLLCSGLLTAMLGLDDMFLIHDQVMPDYLSVGQGFVVGAYGAAGIVYLLAFRAQIARTAYPVLLAAFALLACSVGLDQLQDRWSVYLPASGFLEDAAKLLGIGTWLSYAIHACATPPPGWHPEQAARPTVRRRESAPA